ncbi:hypothetical protein WJX73_001584 [Symbiochloris irregularis]|uniref:F-box protein n=1 Tax=Symbiochloris irregularis TaxID=706552 RepID=A0AAW1NVA6_9CHLO
MPEGGTLHLPFASLEAGLTVGTAVASAYTRDRKLQLLDSNYRNLVGAVRAATLDNGAMLHALEKLVVLEGFGCHGVIRESERCLKLVLKVMFPLRLWQNPQGWKRSSAAALIFSQLQTSDRPVESSSAPVSNQQADAYYSLTSCFEELKPPPDDPGLPPLPQAASDTSEAQLHHLPVESLEAVMSHLDRADLARLANTSRFFRSMAARITPGLKLSLYAHQRAAVRWLLERESAHGASPDPYWRAMKTDDGLPFWISDTCGDFTKEQPPQPQDIKGGFLCDEPGLGKTITGLALILKTLHTTPAAPAGAKPGSPASRRQAVSSPQLTTVPADAAADAGSGDASQGDDSGNLKPAEWVACDICQKWRKLPENSLVGNFWACRMHPDPAFQSCSMPEQSTKHLENESFVEAPGYVLHSATAQSADAVRHFDQVLSRLPAEFYDKRSIAWWLAQQRPESLLSAFKVPRSHKYPETWATFLDELGFQTVEIVSTPKGKMFRKITAAKAKPNAQWVQPLHLSLLRLDTAALKAVLLSGPASTSLDIYLSSATLLVVPATLVQHWVDQVEQHTEPGLLRVKVLLADGNKSAAAPMATSLAWDYDLVITSFTRLSSDWTHLKGKSPLLQVHWLRVILDEGHMLGASLSITNKLQMACALRAERRWVMTGTPTPNTPSSHVAHLQPLLAFLGHQPFGQQRRIFEELVQRPFEAKDPRARALLVHLLGRIMTRASKAALATLPKLTQTVTRLKFAPEHARSYNELVEVIERNLLTADWQDENHVESLLSERQTKWAREMLRNVRLSCCVAGNSNLVVKEEDVKEMLQLVEARLWPAVDGEATAPSASNSGIVKVNSTVAEAGPPWVAEDHPLAALESGVREGCACQACGARSGMPIATPCAHLLCLPCARSCRECCAVPSCGRAYVMQRIDDPIRKKTNPNPQWEVPWEVIEWQASYTQAGAVGISGGQWSANWQVTKSTKCVHLLHRLMHIGAVRAPPPGTRYPAHSRHTGPAGSGGHVQQPLTKAIVFSQFWMHIQLICAHLRAHGVEPSILKRDLSPRAKAEALDVFRHDDECGVLVMDETGAVGLDLSFVSFVFLMEPLQDKSLEQQVIARAHRMGATRPVAVEVLVMQGTAEEHIISMSQQSVNQQTSATATSAQGSGSSTGASHQAQAKQTEADRRRARNELLAAVLA